MEKKLTYEQVISLEPKIKEIIAIAKKRNQMEKMDSANTVDDILRLADIEDPDDNKEKKTITQNLHSVLMNLEIEDLKIIRALMLTGREVYPMGVCPESMEKIDHIDDDEIKETYQWHYKMAENEKRGLVEYIYSKLPLDEYLERGIKGFYKQYSTS